MAMRVVGDGAQYTALEWRTKVLKRPKTQKQILHKLQAWKIRGDLDRAARKLIQLRTAGYEAARSGRIPKALIGRPQFLPRGAYVQERVVILGDALAHRSLAQQKALIKKLISFYQEQWRYGFSERVFNFTINNGLAKDGKVILIDFGEISFSKSHVQATIRNRRWEKSWSVGMISPEVQKYYVQQMRQRLTRDSLNRLWRSAL